ncbi:MAG: glucose dehydrogenase [Chloroflexi bacterium]|nr:PQQ-dependent sugar dehydrogenase [Chloroflexota bacterium]MQC26391.1 glucose dehydrogenase [Chloroflexota bacterium]
MLNTLRRIKTSSFSTLLLAFPLLLLVAACSSGTTETLPTAESNPTSLQPDDLGSIPTVTAEQEASPQSEASATPELIAAPSIPDPDQYSWIEVGRGFSQPLLVTNAGDGSGRLFVVGQEGLIWVIENGQVLSNPFLDIRAQVGRSGNEQGLLGLAFHPNYAEDGRFFVNYTDLNGDTVIASFRASGDANIAEAGSQTILFQAEQPYANHNGGHLEFGPDGYLYFGLGDGGSQGDPNNNAQSSNSPLGKLLRIDVDNGSPYAIPPDNLYANGGGLPEIWAYGLRNPWRFSFDTLTGDLYIGDVGQNVWEEINFLSAGSASGLNFGWNYFEGSHSYAGNPPAGFDSVQPVIEYDHGSGRCSVTGGNVYRGAELPAWNGVYVYADYCSGEVFGLVQDADGVWQSEHLYSLDALITSFGLDEQGEIYLLSRSGSLFKLVAQ